MRREGKLAIGVGIALLIALLVWIAAGPWM